MNPILHAKASASPAASDPTRWSPQETKKYLEDMTKILITCWDGTYGQEGHDMLRQHFTSDFQLDHSVAEFPFGVAKDLEDFIVTLRTIKKTNAEWKMNVFSVSASLDRELEHAVVWFSSGPSGEPGSTGGDWSTNRESVCKLSWRRQQGVWKAYYFVALRGGAFIDSWDMT